VRTARRPLRGGLPGAGAGVDKRLHLGQDVVDDPPPLLTVSLTERLVRSSQASDGPIDRMVVGPGEGQEAGGETEPVQVPVLVGRWSVLGVVGREVIDQAPRPLGDLPLSTTDAPSAAFRRVLGHATLRFLGTGRGRPSDRTGRALEGRKPSSETGPEGVDLLVEGTQAGRVGKGRGRRL